MQENRVLNLCGWQISEEELVKVVEEALEKDPLLPEKHEEDLQRIRDEEREHHWTYLKDKEEKPWKSALYVPLYPYRMLYPQKVTLKINGEKKIFDEELLASIVKRHQSAQRKANSEDASNREEGEHLKIKITEYRDIRDSRLLDIKYTFL